MKAVIDIDDNLYTRLFDNGKIDAADMLKACTAIRKGDVFSKGRWIPVSERMPKADEYVGDVAKYYLVQNEYGDMLVARYTYSEYWEQIYQLQPIGDEIVAWMPLPEPYKEAEDAESNN